MVATVRRRLHPTRRERLLRIGGAVVAVVLLLALLLPTGPIEAAVSANLVRFPSNDPWVTASAIENNGSNVAANAIDGSTTVDWAAVGYSPGDWWRATLASPITIDRIKLSPRDGSGDNFGYGRLRFSDGSSVPFDLRSYTNSSTPLQVDFTAKARIVWVEVVSDGGGGGTNPGLAEVQAFDTAVSTSNNLLRPTSAASYSASATSGGNTAAQGANGSTTTDWGATYTAGMWWRVDWTVAQNVDRIKLYPRDGSSDNYGVGTIHFSDSTTVSFNLSTYTNSSSPLTLNFTRKTGITWFKVTSDSGGGGGSPGLAEVEAFDTTPPPTSSIPDLDAASDTGSLVEDDTTIILRPNADASTSSLTYSSGSTAWSLVDEDVLNTSDYVQANNSGYAFFSFPDPSLGSARIEQVVIKANVTNVAVANTAWLSVRRASDGEVDNVLTLPQSVSADQSVTLTTRTWDDHAWTGSDIDALQVGIVGPASNSKIRVRQIWVEVTYYTRTPSGYDSDNVTADSTPTLSGTVESGASTVDLYDGTDLIGTDATVSGGTWQITSERLDDGVHALWARVTNGASETADSGALAVTIETDGLAALTADTDTGALVPTAGTLTLLPDADEAITGTVTLSAGSTAWNLVDEAILRTSDNAWVKNGSAVMSFPASGLVATDLIDSITVKASVRNPAPANAGSLVVRDPSTTTVYSIDSIPQNPTASRSVTLTSRPWDSQPWTVADLDALQAGAACSCASLQQLRLDQLWIEVAYTTLAKGAYGSDGITNDATPSLGGTNSTTADRVDVLEDSVVIATDSSVSSGTWEVTLPTLSEGEHTFEIEVYDGDDILTGSAPDVDITVDLTAPSAPSTPDLDSGSDTGVHDDDDITDDTTPSFSGTVAAGAIQVELDAGEDRVATDTTIGGGTWGVTTIEIAPGQYDITAHAVDAAGNRGTSDALPVEIVGSLVRLKAFAYPTGEVGNVTYVSVVVQDETGAPLDTLDTSISLDTTDVEAQFPDGSSYAMEPGEDGTGHTFRVLFGSTGSHTVTASASGTDPGTTDEIVVGQGDLELSAPETVYQGQPFALVLTPRTADGRVAMQYAALVELSSSDIDADFGPWVDGSDRFQFECGCDNGQMFGTRLFDLGVQTITAEDDFGNEDTIEVEVVAPSTAGTDPLSGASIVRWHYGVEGTIYLTSSGPITPVMVEDIGPTSTVLGQWPVSSVTLAAGSHTLPVKTTPGWHYVAAVWYEPSYHVLWYYNAQGRLYGTSITLEHRFDDVVDAVNYDPVEPGDPILDWEVVERTFGSTSIEFEAAEPFEITNIQYSFNGTIWQDAGGGTYVAAGTTTVVIDNDPAACYFLYYYDNSSIKFDYRGASGRTGRVISSIPATSPELTGPCTSDPGQGPVKTWLDEYIDQIRDLPGNTMRAVGDPVDTADGFPHAEIAEFALGGLSPALSFVRTYDGRLAEDSNEDGYVDTALGPGWVSNLDWRIVDWPDDPDGVVIRGGDGGELLFLDDGGDFVPMFTGGFTLESITGGYELRRPDRSGVRFDDEGMLVALFDRTGAELTVDYDGNGHIDSFTDAASRTAEVTTDVDGHITLIELPDGREVAYDYDGDGRLVEATDMSGHVMTYTVDSRSRMGRIIDEESTTVLQNVYDGHGRVIRQVDGEGGVTALAYYPDRGLTLAVDPIGGLTTLCYGQFGQLVLSVDALGGRVELGYDENGFLHQVTDQLGHVSSQTNDDRGRPLTISDALDRTATFEYDLDGDPVTLTDTEGRVIDIDYDLDKMVDDITITLDLDSRIQAAYTWTPDLQVETITAPGGGVTTFGYDADGQLTSLLDAEDRETTYDLDPRGYATTVVDGLGNELGGTPADHDWITAFDDMGRTLSSEDPTGAITTYTYDHMGRVETMLDPAGIETTYAYDAAGRLTSESVDIPGDDPAVTSYEYDAAGHLTAVVDAEDRRTEYEVDLLGRVVLLRDADDQEWVTTYDAKGRVTSTTDPTDRTTAFTYDAVDRLLVSTDPGGHETTFEYDDGDRLVSVTDELDGVTEYTYDWLGRPESVTDAEENTTEYEHDAADDLIAVTDALNRVTEFEYDATHRLTLVTDALLGETEYVYDSAGRLIERQDARDNSELYGYDAAGRPTSVTDALTNTWTTVYDPAGRVDHTIDANGDQTDYTYDELGRLETITPEVGDPISFAYDLTDRRLSMTDGAGTTVYAYDPIGRLIETLRAGWTIAYDYDPAGRISEVEYPSSIGTVTYDYDPEGRLETLTDWDDRETTFAYDALDRVETITRPDDLVTTLAYDALSRVTSLVHAYDGTPEVTIGYTYDEVGNVETRTDDLGAATFGYDDLDRLESADYPGANDHAWTYDEVGNLLSITDPNGTVNHTYDAADRIDDVGFSYDDNGALLSDGVRTFTYDALGRLTGVSASGLSASYVLDGDGNRVSQTVDTVATAFDLDLRGLATPLVAGDIAILPGMPELGFLDGSDWFGALSDADGSILAHIDPLGSMTALTRYDPYGNARLSTTLPEGFGYAGEWADASGLINLRARAYDPYLGAFTSRDSFPGVLLSPLTGNRHAYALGNPLRYQDPSGHFVRAALENPGETASLVIQSIPGLGDLYSIGIGLWGWDPIAGRQLSWEERALAVASGLMPFALPRMGLADDAVTGLRHADDGLGLAERSADDVAGLGRGLDDVGGSLRRNIDFGSDARGGLSCARSFAGDTDVLMADGTTKPISQIVVGDRVVAFDPETGERTIETVEAVWSHADELVELQVEGGSIITTEDHPFWDADDGRWQDAQELVRGDNLLDADGDRIRVLGLVPGTEHGGIAWNLTVSGPHTYHVAAGDQSVLVHNACWKVGDDYLAPTGRGTTPAWSTQRARFWKNEAQYRSSGIPWNDDQLARMRRGLAPQRYNPKKRGIESMELSHEPIPQRDGGTQVLPRWPEDHARVDPHRHVNY